MKSYSKCTVRSDWYSTVQSNWTTWQRTARSFWPNSFWACRSIIRRRTKRGLPLGGTVVLCYATDKIHSEFQCTGWAEKITLHDLSWLETTRTLAVFSSKYSQSTAWPTWELTVEYQGSATPDQNAWIGEDLVVLVFGEYKKSMVFVVLFNLSTLVNCYVNYVRCLLWLLYRWYRAVDLDRCQAPIMAVVYNYIEPSHSIGRLRTAIAWLKLLTQSTVPFWVCVRESSCHKGMFVEIALPRWLLVGRCSHIVGQEVFVDRIWMCASVYRCVMCCVVEQSRWCTAVVMAYMVNWWVTLERHAIMYWFGVLVIEQRVW